MNGFFHRVFNMPLTSFEQSSHYDPSCTEENQVELSLQRQNKRVVKKADEKHAKSLSLIKSYRYWKCPILQGTFAVSTQNSEEKPQIKHHYFFLMGDGKCKENSLTLKDTKTPAMVFSTLDELDTFFWTHYQQPADRVTTVVIRDKSHASALPAHFKNPARIGSRATSASLKTGEEEKTLAAPAAKSVIAMPTRAVI